MIESHAILLVQGPDGDDLARRLRALGCEVLVARDLAEADGVVATAFHPVPVAFVPTEGAEQGLKAALKGLRKRSRELMTVAYGEPADAPTRKALRSAGVSLALWSPFDDGTLRFQLNRALTRDRDVHGRRRLRVPTYLMARVNGGGRSREALVYSLSEEGAFLETPRASMEGASLQVELALPGGSLTLPAQVVFSNVIGNLQRPNLPLGMGIRFTEDAPPDAVQSIARYVRARATQLEL